MVYENASRFLPSFFNVGYRTETVLTISHFRLLIWWMPKLLKMTRLKRWWNNQLMILIHLSKYWLCLTITVCNRFDPPPFSRNPYIWYPLYWHQFLLLFGVVPIAQNDWIHFRYQVMKPGEGGKVQSLWNISGFVQHFSSNILLPEISS